MLVSATLADANPTVLALATAIGLLAALVQFWALSAGPSPSLIWPAWPVTPATTPATRDAVKVTFPTLNRYLGSRLVSTPGICSPAYGPPWPASPSPWGHSPSLERCVEGSGQSAELADGQERKHHREPDDPGDGLEDRAQDRAGEQQPRNASAATLIGLIRTEGL